MCCVRWKLSRMPENLLVFRSETAWILKSPPMMNSDSYGTKLSSRFWNSSRKEDILEDGGRWMLREMVSSLPVESLVAKSSKDSGGVKLWEKKSLNFSGMIKKSQKKIAKSQDHHLDGLVSETPPYCASPVWWGFTDASDKQRLQAVINRAQRLGLLHHSCHYTIGSRQMMSLKSLRTKILCSIVSSHQSNP